tara:strand:+ start:848 stop:2155 length:1308 start_codon:yes stop_codon:yes gene_type:complete
MINHDAERALLGGLMADAAAHPEVFDTIGSEHFHKPSHSRIYDAIRKLYDAHEPVDSITVSNTLSSEQAKHVTHDIDAACYSSVNLDHYAQIVAEASQRRQLVDTCRQFTELEGDRPVDDLIDEAVGQLTQIADTTKAKLQGCNELVKSVLGDIEKRAQGQISVGHKTGFIDLDRMIGGLADGALYILGGRPSMGKSALGLSIGLNVSRISQLPVMVFSLEMTSESLVERLIAAEARVELSQIRTGQLSSEQWSRMAAAASSVAELPLSFDDASAVSTAEIRRKARRLKHEQGGLGLIVIDYLQLMTGKSKEREREIAEISRELKRIAKDLECPVLCLAQLNRGVESRDDKRPRLSDLRESGAIEQDADVCAFVYRDSYYNEQAEPINTWGGFNSAVTGGVQKEDVELLIRKNRAGRTGTVNLNWLGAYTRFENV